jgi:acyl dehydratase
MVVGVGSGANLRIVARGTSSPEVRVEMLFYDDMNPGHSMTSASVTVDRDEMVEFAKRWDPLPMHVDEQAAQAAGGLTAPGLFVLALKQRLVHRLPGLAVIASMGYDDVRFHEPVRPNDKLHLHCQWIDRRVSESKPDRGVVTVRLSLINQTGATVMSHLDTVLVRRREPRVPSSGNVAPRRRL